MVEVMALGFGAGTQGSLGQPGGGRETVILQRGSPPIRSPRRDLSQEAVPVGAVLITIPGPFNCVHRGPRLRDPCWAQHPLALSSISQHLKSQWVSGFS